MDDQQFEEFMAEVSGLLEEAMNQWMLRNFEKSNQIVIEAIAFIHGKIPQMGDDDRKQAEEAIRRLEELRTKPSTESDSGPESIH